MFINRRTKLFVNERFRFKRSWVIFITEEALQVLNRYLESYKPNPRIFPYSPRSLSSIEKVFRLISEQVGVKITPHTLRAIFADRLAKAGIPDRYVDALQGRTPASELARQL
ncbi:hypothetical protein DRO58_06515 [Candidatus Bathyarchaeota archaeon]|nr:MAG: hypothetical protein DRO58_06515 [Candidatus Bathyarchaeota archaeon]